jgi:hypothetical protein
MSTQFYTQDQPATSHQDTGHGAPRPHHPAAGGPGIPPRPSGRFPSVRRPVAA